LISVGELGLQPFWTQTVSRIVDTGWVERGH